MGNDGGVARLGVLVVAHEQPASAPGEDVDTPLEEDPRLVAR